MNFQYYLLQKMQADEKSKSKITQIITLQMQGKTQKAAKLWQKYQLNVKKSFNQDNPVTA